MLRGKSVSSSLAHLSRQVSEGDALAEACELWDISEGDHERGLRLQPKVLLDRVLVPSQGLD